MIRRTFRRPHRRRGAILLVVLGMLALFAVVGLSFVLYAESEATGSRNNRAARNELADPDPALVANTFLSQVLFGPNDTTSALYGHDLARSRFNQPGGQSPYTGTTGVPSEGLTLTGLDAFNASLPALTLDRTQAINFRNITTPSFPGFGWQQVSPDVTLTNTPINKAVPWTYPDRNNFYLAHYDPTTDQVTVPSFHRPSLFLNTAFVKPEDQVLQSLHPNNPKWRNTDPANPGSGDSTGYWMTLRPRQAEHPLFPTVPQNADGSFTGDVANMKLFTGSQKNDSLWMDLNLPIKEWRGKRYKPLVAPLILDLGGKINLSVAGNAKAGGGHGGTHGWGPWEVNPAPDASPTAFLAGGKADLANLLNARYTTAATPLNRFTALSAGTLNGGLLPSQYSVIDADGWGNAAPDAPTLPAAGQFYPFAAYTNRFAKTQPLLTAELAGPHGQSFSPFQHSRRLNPLPGSTWVPSLEDQLRLSFPVGGPKGNTGFAGVAKPNPRTTTLFSVSQRWAEVSVPVDATGKNFVRLAAIDLARPLPDYRVNLNGPLSPQNLSPATLAAARIARQNLAREIFVRLAAVFGTIDGTNVYYDPTYGYLGYGPKPPVDDLRFYAQYAANLVDQIDTDDVSTTFVWNPTPAGLLANPLDPAVDPGTFDPGEIGNRVVYGTELPKLVLNEVYCAMDNDRADMPPPAAGGMQKAQQNFRKRFWIELHNPLPSDPAYAASPHLDPHAARLQYDPDVAGPTQVYDGTAGNFANYAGLKYAAYQIEVAEVPAPAAGNPPATPYSTFLNDPTVATLALVNDNVAVPIPPKYGLTHKIVLNNYSAWNAYTAPLMADKPALLPANDALNVIPPANGNSGLPGTTTGYFLIGPRDQLPSTPAVNNSLNVVDPKGSLPLPENSLTYDAGTKDGNANPSPYGTSSVILLRRLVNPYMLPELDSKKPNYNPYMTVDYLENVPTRDRALFDTNGNGNRAPTSPNGSTVGRRHPYASAPVYNPAQVALGTPPFPAVIDQVDAAVTMGPPHTFLKYNSNLDNNRLQPAPANALGLEWLVHLDRTPVNGLELLHTSGVSPANLTQKFYNGAVYQKHLNPYAAAGTPGLPIFFSTGARALDMLTVGSRLPGIPLGGREPGRLNVNSANDSTALLAVLDPQTGNRFDAPYVSTAWTGLAPTRTTTGTPGATVYEVVTTGPPAANGTDRPFQPGGSLFQDTLFRQGSVANYPILFNPATDNHLYAQAEPLRKGWNNMTTVSDGFLLTFTVGFFEVDSANRLGKEIFDKVPGDLRTQYAGIVDRTAITQNVDPATSAFQPTVLGPKPWETKLAADAPLDVSRTSFTIHATPGPAANQFTVYDEGTAVTITAPAPAAPQLPDTGPLLYLGYSQIAAGGDGEWVRVNTITPGPVGSGTVTISINTTASTDATKVQYSTTLKQFHGASSRVSNALLGHPGPQPGFDYREPTGKYRGVLPYFMRMVP